MRGSLVLGIGVGLAWLVLGLTKILAWATLRWEEKIAAVGELAIGMVIVSSGAHRRAFVVSLICAAALWSVGGMLAQEQCRCLGHITVSIEARRLIAAGLVVASLLAYELRRKSSSEGAVLRRRDP